MAAKSKKLDCLMLVIEPNKQEIALDVALHAILVVAGQPMRLVMLR